MLASRRQRAAVAGPAANTGPVPGERGGHAGVNGISLSDAAIGHGSPAVRLQGGRSNSDYWVTGSGQASWFDPWGVAYHRL